MPDETFIIPLAHIAAILCGNDRCRFSLHKALLHPLHDVTLRVHTDDGIPQRDDKGLIANEGFAT